MQRKNSIVVNVKGKEQYTEYYHQRIRSNQMPIKQIAYKFGIINESHLSNYLKKKEKYQAK